MRGCQLAAANEFGIRSLCLLQAGKVFFGNHQDMCRALRIEIFEGEGMLVFVNFLGWNLAADDAARSVMGGEARSSAVHNWSIESMAERTLSWYHACLDNAENANQDERQPGARNVLRHRMLKRDS